MQEMVRKGTTRYCDFGHYADSFTFLTILTFLKTQNFLTILTFLQNDEKVRIMRKVKIVREAKIVRKGATHNCYFGHYAHYSDAAHYSTGLAFSHYFTITFWSWDCLGPFRNQCILIGLGYPLQKPMDFDRFLATPSKTHRF